MTCLPECGGGGNRNFTALRFFGPCTARVFSFDTRVSSVFALRARLAVEWRIESARSDSRLISCCWRSDSFASRISSWRRDSRYCEYVPRYSVSPASSRCSTRVIAASSSTRSWLTTSSAPR